jgi:hypothetical protein
LFRGPDQSNAEITIASAIVTFWCIETESGRAWKIDPIRSPTSRAIPHHESAQARTPRVFQDVAYSTRSASASPGIAPREFEMRYVVLERIGNRERWASSGSFGMGVALRRAGA